MIALLPKHNPRQSPVDGADGLVRCLRLGDVDEFVITLFILLHGQVYLGILFLWSRPQVRPTNRKNEGQT